MASTAILKVDIISDFNSAGLKAGEDALADLGRAAVNTSKVIAGALAVGAVAAVNAASDQEQAFGALESVFGDNADAMKDWSQTAADIGLSAADAAQQAAILGASLKGSGLDAEEAATQSQQLVELGADLAATFGGTTADAVDALGATLRGEYDSIERFGVAIKQSDVNARLAANGQAELTGEALKAAEQAARLELVWEATGDAQGQFARESDTVAASMQTLQADLANTTAELGKALLPAAEAVVDILKDMADWVGDNTDEALTFAKILGGLAAAVLLVNAAVKTYIALAKAYRAIQVAVNTVTAIYNVLLLTNPIVLVVAAIVALIAVTATVLYLTRDKWLPVLKRLWEWVKKVASVVWDALGAALDWVLGRINAVIGAVQNLISWLSNLIGKAADAARKINPFTRGGTTGGTATGPLGVASARAATTQPQVVVNVSGALDADSVARQVKRLIRDHEHRVGASGREYESVL